MAASGDKAMPFVACEPCTTIPPYLFRSRFFSVETPSPLRGRRRPRSQRLRSDRSGRRARGTSHDLQIFNFGSNEKETKLFYELFFKSMKKQFSESAFWIV